MLVLGIETSGPYTDVALVRDGEVIGNCFSGRRFAHSETLNLMVERLLNTNLLDFKDIELIGVSIGPGFFTALRVGLSFAKALAFTLGTRIIPVNTLDALAYEVDPQISTTAVPAIDAQKGEVYSAVFQWDGNFWVRVTSYAIVKPEVLAAEWPDAVFVGSGAIRHRLSPRPSHDPLSPRASIIARLALQKINEPEIHPSQLEPFYLRLPDAVVNKMLRERKGTFGGNS
ncbi:MAG: tRNA (adenosine(37)-N6)-threonylcarbamoyltransferase complex dimerization subunit type 1 TsaB [Candidatus Hydrothermota bacterium]|nr:MAG: tRNA (adenosine(37)-N6)-threonylcarbamoyltransferase complex dimerization subunit type 1 TsaB [Candidatus Hydrothermae bacterium]